MTTRTYKPLILIVSLLALASCTPTVEQRGNMLQDHQMKQVIPGIHSRTDVLRLLGSPTSQATFDENIWYYIGQKTEKHGIFDPEVVESRVVEISYSSDGLVQHVAEIDGDRVNVPYARAKTPTHGNDLTIMQQLLGNLGRFNPEEKETLKKSKPTN
jgi:outer membrane protein assembly factor BamE (lipoprotein component of BamABCDE complex)